MTSPSATRSLYRNLLRAVRTFPSRKREALREDIRAEFREGARLTDAAAASHAVEVAVRGLATMRKYTSLDPLASHWVVDLEQAPLGVARSDVVPGSGGAFVADASSSPVRKL